MSERRFVLLDFTHMSRVGFLQLYEAGRLRYRAISPTPPASASLLPGSSRRIGYVRACSEHRSLIAEFHASPSYAVQKIGLTRREIAQKIAKMEAF
jgi:hypothetical protein